MFHDQSTVRAAAQSTLSPHGRTPSNGCTVSHFIHALHQVSSWKPKSNSAADPRAKSKSGYVWVHVTRGIISEIVIRDSTGRRKAEGGRWKAAVWAYVIILELSCGCRELTNCIITRALKINTSEVWSAMYIHTYIYISIYLYKSRRRIESIAKRMN